MIRLKNVVATAAAGAFAATAVALAAPSTAGAVELVDVQAPTVKASSSGTTVNISITNPHKVLDGVGCNAVIVNAAKIPAVVANPLEILEPGTVVFPSFKNFESLFGVLAGQTKDYVVKDVEPGVYGVIGACASLWNIGEVPTISTPQVLTVIDADFGSLGSAGSSEIPAFGSSGGSDSLGNLAFGS